jgi:hypothetical protein
MNLSKKQLVNSLDRMFFKVSYSGKKRIAFVSINHDVTLKKLHDLFKQDLGIWNKHRKANSKLLKHNAEYREKLAFNTVHNIARYTNFGVVVN